MRVMRRALVAVMLTTPAVALAETPDAARPSTPAAAAPQPPPVAASGQAIGDCDRLAAAPFDPAAKAPPVRFAELADKAEAAVRACQDALLADPGEARIRFQLGRALLARSDSPHALVLLREAAAAGKAEAQYLIALAFPRLAASASASQASRPVSREEAERALRAAAEAGHTEAMYRLAQALAEGRSIRRDRAESRRWLERVIADPAAAALMPGPAVLLGKLLTTDPAASEDDRRRGFTLLEQHAQASAEGRHAYLYALRRGLGVAPDPARARAMLEAGVADSPAEAAELADMLIKGEGGPKEVKRAVALLRSDAAQRSGEAQAYLARLHLAGAIVGRDPRKAIALLAARALYDRDTLLELVPLIVSYRARLPNPQQLAWSLEEIADTGDAEAMFALAELKLASVPGFGDEQGGWSWMERAEGAGHALAALRVAQRRAERARSDPALATRVRATIDRLTEKNLAAAFTVLGKLQRQGVVYPQDDVAATQAFVRAAELGDTEAMVLLAKAYDDGRGVAENKRARIDWLRRAARAGSIDGMAGLVGAFHFDSFDRLINLREGVALAVVLFNDEAGGVGAIDVGFTFSHGRINDFGRRDIAQAILDGYRAAPAGLKDERIVDLMRAVPQEVKAEIEKLLKEEGFFAGEPQGYAGPLMRAGIAAYVEAKDPLPLVPSPAMAATAAAAASPAAASKVEAQAAASAAASAAQPAAAPTRTISAEAFKRAADRAFEAGKAAKTDADRRRAVKMLTALARYGYEPARWVLVRNYHQSRIVRAEVAPAEVIRYAALFMAESRDWTPKADFEFIFNATQVITKDRKPAAVGEGLLAALRDNARMQADGIGVALQQLQFVPGGCEALAAFAAKEKIAVSRGDGCADAARQAYVAYAGARGPTDLDAKARAKAEPEVLKIAGADR